MSIYLHSISHLCVQFVMLLRHCRFYRLIQRARVSSEVSLLMRHYNKEMHQGFYIKNVLL